MHSPDPLSLHVYRVGGFFGNDKVIKAQDKVTAVYYLKSSRRVAQWELALHDSGPDGALLCHVSSGYTGPPMIDDIPSGPTIVNIISEQRSVKLEKRRGTPDSTQWFKGPDNADYHWKSIRHLWRNEMQCLDTKGEIVATYRATTLALSKDGELRIYPPGQILTDLLVATILAIQTPSH